MNAPKRSALDVDAGLLAQAEAAGLDAGALAARAIRRALDERDRDRIRAEIRREVAWYNAFVAEHGSFADLMREEFGDDRDAPASV